MTKMSKGIEVWKKKKEIENLNHKTNNIDLTDIWGAVCSTTAESTWFSKYGKHFIKLTTCGLYGQRINTIYNMSLTSVKFN